MAKNKIKRNQKQVSKVSKNLNNNKNVWKAKKDAGLSLKSPISDFVIPAELGEFSEALVNMHALEFS